MTESNPCRPTDPTFSDQIEMRIGLAKKSKRKLTNKRTEEIRREHATSGFFLGLMKGNGRLRPTTDEDDDDACDLVIGRDTELET